LDHLRGLPGILDLQAHLPSMFFAGRVTSESFLSTN